MRFKRAREAPRRIIDLVVLGLGLLSGCASVPRVPAWTHAPARAVDNGYIVYTGSGQEGDPNRAQLAAEGSAIQDLANECSFAPKGARVEDHFLQQSNGAYTAYARVAVDFQTCETAQNAVDPETVRKLASAPFTDELKRYQELIGTESEVAAVGESDENPDAAAPIADDDQFFVARQYVAYQKQVVIMAPPGSYAPGSDEAQIYLGNVAPALRPLQAYYARNPRLRSASTTWSAVAPRARRRFPRAFAVHRARRPRRGRPAPKRRRRRRRRRRRPQN